MQCKRSSGMYVEIISLNWALGIGSLCFFDGPAVKIWHMVSTSPTNVLLVATRDSTNSFFRLHKAFPQSNSQHCTVLHCTALLPLPLHWTALHYNTLYYTTLHYTALYCTALYCNALHCSAMYSTSLRWTGLHYTNNTIYYTTLNWTSLHCYVLHCHALHCIALHFIALHCSRVLSEDDKAPSWGGAGGVRCITTPLPYTVVCTALHCWLYCTALFGCTALYYILHCNCISLNSTYLHIAPQSGLDCWIFQCTVLHTALHYIKYLYSVHYTTLHYTKYLYSVQYSALR